MCVTLPKTNTWQKLADLPPPVIGAAWALGSMVVFSFVPVSVRVLSDTMTSYEIVFLRAVMGVAFFVCLMLWRSPTHLRTSRLPLHLLRGLLNFVGMAMWFHALGIMPIAEAVAIHFTMPLFIVIFAAIFLGERVGIRRTAATLVGFAGVLIIVRPGVQEVGLPALLVLGSAAIYAVCAIMVKLIVRTDAPAAVTFYTNLGMMIFAAGPAIYHWTDPTWNDLPGLALLGVAGTLAPYMLTRAFAAIDASLVAVFDFSRLPFTALIAYFIFAEVPVIWVWIGGAVIFSSSYYITRREAKLAKAKNPDDGEAP